MKLKLFIGMILTAAILLGACVGTKALGILDETIPEGMQCNLEIRNNLAVILYNNQPVEWAPGFTQNKVTIAIPPGEHSFMTRYYASRNVGPNMTETYAVTANIPATEFKPGHSYRIYKQNIWIVIGTITKVKIKDVTPKAK